MKYTLLEISSTTTKKDGSIMLSKKGNPFTLVKIQVQDEFGAKIYASGFDDAPTTWTRGWKPGDIVDIELEEKGVYNGYPQYNFHKAGDIRVSPIQTLFEKVKKLEERVTALESPQDGKERIDLAGLPF